MNGFHGYGSNVPMPASQPSINNDDSRSRRAGGAM